jgi:hypothetical protein
MGLFEDDLVEEYMDWKKANPNNFSWWKYVNIKADLQTALGFAKFFFPDVIEVEGCFLLKDKFQEDIYNEWKSRCNNAKICIEKMMNLYEVKDFFHINKQDDENEEEQIKVLGDVLQMFWLMSFKHRYPNRNIKVSVFEEFDELFITVYEEQEQ